VSTAPQKSSPRNPPVVVGLLRASGETIEGPRPCDWFDAFVDDRGDLVVLLLDAPSGIDSFDGLVATIAYETHAALRRCMPLHAVVSGLQVQLAAQPGLEVGVLILRLSQQDAKVELLNAGMPALASADPGGGLQLYPALSGPVGRRVGEAHPYELLPLLWDGTWLALSDGMLNGSRESAAVSVLCAKIELGSRGPELSRSTREELYDAFQGLLPSARFLRDDATGVVVSVCPGARFQSGIERGSGATAKTIVSSRPEQ